MVAIAKLIASVALFSATVFASPRPAALERRQTCIVTDAVTAAEGLILGCAVEDVLNPSALVTCVLAAVVGLTPTELVSLQYIQKGRPGTASNMFTIL